MGAGTPATMTSKGPPTGRSHAARWAAASDACALRRLAGEQRRRSSLFVDDRVDGEAQRRARGDLPQRLLERVAFEASELDTGLRDEDGPVRPGDGRLAGAADRHRLDAAREAGVQVGFDDPHADDERSRGDAPVHEHRRSPGGGAKVGVRSLEALRVEGLDPVGDALAEQRAALAGGRRRVQAAADGDGDARVGHAGGAELGEEALDDQRRRAGTRGIRDGDHDLARRSSRHRLAGKLAEASRRDRLGERARERPRRVLGGREPGRRLERVGVGHRHPPSAAEDPGARRCRSPPVPRPAALLAPAARPPGRVVARARRGRRRRIPEVGDHHEDRPHHRDHAGEDAHKHPVEDAAVASCAR